MTLASMARKYEARSVPRGEKVATSAMIASSFSSIFVKGSLRSNQAIARAAGERHPNRPKPGGNEGCDERFRGRDLTARARRLVSVGLDLHEGTAAWNAG